MLACLCKFWGGLQVMYINDLSLYSYFLVILLKIIFSWLSFALPCSLFLSLTFFSFFLLYFSSHSVFFFFFLVNIFKILNSQPMLRIPSLDNFCFYFNATPGTQKSTPPRLFWSFMIPTMRSDMGLGKYMWVCVGETKKTVKYKRQS